MGRLVGVKGWLGVVEVVGWKSGLMSGVRRDGRGKVSKIVGGMVVGEKRRMCVVVSRRCYISQ